MELNVHCPVNKTPSYLVPDVSSPHTHAVFKTCLNVVLRRKPKSPECVAGASHLPHACYISNPPSLYHLTIYKEENRYRLGMFKIKDIESTQMCISVQFWDLLFNRNQFTLQVQKEVLHLPSELNNKFTHNTWSVWNWNTLRKTGMTYYLCVICSTSRKERKQFRGRK